MGLNWMDVTVIVVLLAGALSGMAKGFILSIFNIVGMFISLILAKYFTPAASVFIINNTSVYQKLRELFMNRMSTINPSTIQLLRFFSNNSIVIEDTFTMIFINIAVFICIFMISTLIINMLRDSIKFTVRKTPLKYIDIAGGFLIGILKSTILIYMVFAILTPLMGLIPQKKQIMETIDSSFLARNFYYYNFILSWFEKINQM
jgi:uncharacterized membrane protein required for colicin V production